MAEAKLEELNQHLTEIVEALQSAVSWGMSHRDEPQALDKAVLDSKELIDQVMDASILTW